MAWSLFGADGVPRHSPETAQHFLTRGLWTTETIYERFAATAARYANRVGLVDALGRMTYAELHDRVDRVAAGLVRLGIAPGQVISVQLPNYREYVELVLASARIGAIVNPINPRVRGELEYMLRMTQSPLVVIPQRFHDFDYADMVAGLRANMPNLRHVVVARGHAPSGMLPFDALCADPATVDLPTMPSSIYPWLVVFTSGTTGNPKGVVRSHANTLSTLRSYVDPYRFVTPGGDDVALAMLPITHIFGLYWCVLSCLLNGVRVVMQEWFEPTGALDFIERERVTMIGLVPSMLDPLARALDAKRRDLSSLRLVQPAGEAVSTESKQRIIDRLGCAVSEVYGLSECTWPVSHRPDAPLEKRLVTSGTLTPGVEMRIVDDEGRGVPAGRPGELVFRGPNVFAGYYKNPEATAVAIEPDGWFHSGDIGTIDCDGYVAIAGRKRDMIIRQGLNIFPSEIEEFLAHHPKILRVAVIGLPHSRTGEQCVACIVPKPGETVTKEEVARFLEGKVAVFKLPERVEIMSELPMSAMGKVLKRVLQANLKEP